MEGFELGRRRPLRLNGEPPVSSHHQSAPSYLSSENTESLIKEALFKINKEKRKNINHHHSPQDNPNKVLPLIEIDLHIHELVDSTAGMDNYTMLQFQLDTVRKTMKKHYRRIGQKIVFIHGKGDGVLRKEMRLLLAKEYASCDVQDASFLKYGYGATEVTVRQSR